MPKKGEAIRKIPINPKTLRLIDAYLKKAGHGDEMNGPLFRPKAAAWVPEQKVDAKIGKRTLSLNNYLIKYRAAFGQLMSGQ